MKIIYMLFLLISLDVFCQDKPNDVGEEQIETAVENSEDAVTDDSYWQSQMFYKKHPLNLNEASENELRELKLLSDPQIENFSATGNCSESLSVFTNCRLFLVGIFP